MNLYLDDDSAKTILIARLRTSGHQVTIPNDVSLRGAADPRHLLFTVSQNMVLLTRNHDDFQDLHLLIQAVQGQHPGIIAIRFDNDPNRDMKDADIVRAIRNLERAGIAIANEFHVLNHWR
ncbi:MAG: DUF5615 family PIN-like protein [Planctomycetes bacterium]|nr:DUF5615 family PIN-like protein [Planctomycetota bacterium]